MNCIILGDHSEIAQGLRPMLIADGYGVVGWHRGMHEWIWPQWDLVICAIGSVAPVGHWSKVENWDNGVAANLLKPMRLLRKIWPNHNPGASVCFLAGANPNKAGPNYSAYYTGKMALLKAIETIDAETPDAKFFALAPGIVFTKIHQPTYDSGIVNEGLEARRGVGGTPIEKIYYALRWCIAQDKETMGGRNICVSDPLDPMPLKNNPSLFKLRRVE